MSNFIEDARVIVNDYLHGTQSYEEARDSLDVLMREYRDSGVEKDREYCQNVVSVLVAFYTDALLTGIDEPTSGYFFNIILARAEELIGDAFDFKDLVVRSYTGPMPADEADSQPGNTPEGWQGSWGAPPPGLG